MSSTSDLQLVGRHSVVFRPHHPIDEPHGKRHPARISAAIVRFATTAVTVDQLGQLLGLSPVLFRLQVGRPNEPRSDQGHRVIDQRFPRFSS